MAVLIKKQEPIFWRRSQKAFEIFWEQETRFHEYNLLIQYSWMNRWCEACDGLSRIARIQQEVVGEDLPDYHLSLEYAAWANYSLTNFNGSTKDQARATAGLSRTAGPTNKECLGAK